MANISIDKLAGETALAICTPENPGEKWDIEALENLATKALGVLQEHGVYAMIVFLLSRSGEKSFDDSKASKENKAAIQLVQALVNALSKSPLNTLDITFTKTLNRNIHHDKAQLLQHFIRKIAKDLEKLLFVKEFYENTLIYVRHIAKGLKNAG